MIKLYAWEIPFQRLVFGIRQQELDQLKKNALLNATASITWTCAPFLVSIDSKLTLVKTRVAVFGVAIVHVTP